jgi:zinc protease
MRASWLLIVACLWPRMAEAQTRSLADLPAETVTLPNGLRVVLAPDALARMVSVEVDYSAGAADDPDGLHGLAHFTEHLTYVRTAHAARLLGLLYASGATAVQGTTSTDATTYAETVPRERLDIALWLESERMGYAASAVTEVAVKTERAVIVNELRLPSLVGEIDQAVARALFPPWHPYAFRHPTDDDLGSIHAADVQAFMRTWYVPSNAVLVLAGRFDRAEALAKVVKYFGAIPAGVAPGRPTLPVSTPVPATITAMMWGNAGRASFFWRTPAFGTADDHVLDVVARLLAGSPNNILTPALVAPGLATQVAARQASKREGSTFVVTAVVPRTTTVSHVADEAATALAKLALGPSAIDLDSAKVGLRTSILSELETTWGRATRLASLAQTGRLPGPGFDWGIHDYDAIEAADVTRVAKAWLGREHRVTELVYANAAVGGTTVTVTATPQGSP